MESWTSNTLHPGWILHCTSFYQLWEMLLNHLGMKGGNERRKEMKIKLLILLLLNKF